MKNDIHVLSRKGELFRSVAYVSVHKRGFFTKRAVCNEKEHLL